MGLSTTCAFTGHRPEKLPWGTHEEDLRCLALKSRLMREIAQAYDLGCRHFITGMARGADLYFGESVLAFRQTHPDVTLEAAIPFAEQAAHWPTADQARYKALLDQCHVQTMVQHHYDRGCLLRRNRYMVDHAARLIAVYDGKGGGTLYTITYALEQNRQIVIIDL